MGGVSKYSASHAKENSPTRRHIREEEKTSHLLEWLSLIVEAFVI